jgi:hypothetical protein
MLLRSTYASAGEPSFFYLMMADTCFRRATSAVHPKAANTLRNIGHDYLMRATEVTSTLEAQPSKLGALQRLVYSSKAPEII